MESRRPNRTLLRRVATTASLAALLIVPAGQAEAAKKKKVKTPVVTSVRPMEAAIGDTLTIHGRNFRRGKGTNSVVFKRDGARAVFLKADVSTTKQIKVVLSDKLEEFLVIKDGAPGLTRFRVRVLAQRFAKKYTSASKSPMIGPKRPPGTGPDEGPGPAAPDGDCDGDKVNNGADPDDDNDLLSDAREDRLKTDPCKRDTDGDGVEDGFEVQSAKDLNDDRYQNPNTPVPYPEKQPYANALFADAETDYDGDGLWLKDEYELWVAYGERKLAADGESLVLNYSDGLRHSVDQNTVGYDKHGLFLQRAAQRGYDPNVLLNMDQVFVPGISGQGDDYDAYWGGSYAPNPSLTDVERFYYDWDYDGKLSDDERDEDADGLSNWVETHGPMTPAWWERVYKNGEKPFSIKFAGTKHTDWDSDGDGVVDGADDNDFDDVPNVREIRRQVVAGEVPAGTPVGNANYATFVLGADKDSILWARESEGTDDEPRDSGPWRAWVQPFNPCLPDPRSRSCEKYPTLVGLSAPFEQSTKVFKVIDGQFFTPE